MVISPEWTPPVTHPTCTAEGEGTAQQLFNSTANCFSLTKRSVIKQETLIICSLRCEQVNISLVFFIICLL